MRPVAGANATQDLSASVDLADFRKLILSAVLATGAIAGVTATSSTADAAPFDRGRDFHRRQYEVLVECGHRWENRGTFRDRQDGLS